MEMSKIARCQSCNGDFDGYDKLPMMLPCQHNICYACAHNNCLRNRNIRCVQQTCQQVHIIHPSKLQEDSQLVKLLEQKVLSESISILENQQVRVKSVSTQLSKQQFMIIFKITQHLNNYVFKDSIALLQELKQQSKTIKYQLNQLKMIKNQMSCQGNMIHFIQQGFNNSSMQFRIQQLVVDAQKVMLQNSNISIKVFEELDILKLNLNHVNQTCINFKNQLQQLNFQIVNLQQEKQNLENQVLALQINNMKLLKQQESKLITKPQVKFELAYDSNQGKFFIFKTQVYKDIQTTLAPQIYLLTVNELYREVQIQRQRSGISRVEVAKAF